MAAKRKHESEPEETPASVPDVLTVSEHEQLTDEQKQAFKSRNGTVTNDPT